MPTKRKVPLSDKIAEPKHPDCWDADVLNVVYSVLRKSVQRALEIAEEEGPDVAMAWMDSRIVMHKARRSAKDAVS